MSGNTLSHANGVIVTSAPHVAIATEELTAVIAEELVVPDPVDVAKATELLCNETTPRKKSSCGKTCKKPSCDHNLVTSQE